MNVYNTIANPLTGAIVPIYGKLGLHILSNYIAVYQHNQRGGSSSLVEGMGKSNGYHGG